jgi:hypothetical protein
MRGISKSGGLALLAAMLCWSGAEVAAAAAKACQLEQLAQIEVVGSGGSVTVPLKINGHAGRMMFQLGSGLPGIFEQYLGELGLQDSLEPLVTLSATVGDQKIKNQVRVDSTVLGNANFTRWYYAVFPVADQSSRLQIQGQPVYGVMTSSFMTAVDLELDLGAGFIRLFKPNKCRGNPVYWEGEVTSVDLSADSTGQLLFPMEVEGQQVMSSLNTISVPSVINADVVHRYLGFDVDSPGVERDTTASGQEVATFRAMSLTAKGLNVRNARVRINQMPGCGVTKSRAGATSTRTKGQPVVHCQSSLAMAPFSIGTDLMKRMRIYVSLADKKIYFTRSDSTDAQPAPVIPTPN